MTPQDFEALLRRTLADGALTGSEKAALTKVVLDEQFDEAQLALCRHQAFALAKQHLGDARAAATVDWLEAVVKALTPAKAAPAAAPAVSVAEAYFSPGDACTRAIIRLIQGAKRTMDLCVFTVTDDRISDAILRAHRAGVRVRLVTDNDKAHDLGSDTDRLRQGGVRVAIDVSPAHMHHKFGVFDGATLLTGSFNWTRSAAMHNEENVIVTNDARLLAAFQRLFDTLWQQWGPPGDDR